MVGDVAQNNHHGEEDADGAIFAATCFVVLAALHVI